MLEFIDNIPFGLYELLDVFFILGFCYRPPIYRLNLWFCHVFQAFCVMSMPVIVPVRAVIAEKISLFHLPRNAMWIVSSVERISVMVMVNFTPISRRGSGGISRCRIRFVNAFLIQSFMVGHFLLFFVALG